MLNKMIKTLAKLRVEGGQRTRSSRHVQLLRYAVQIVASATSAVLGPKNSPKPCHPLLPESTLNPSRNSTQRRLLGHAHQSRFSAVGKFGIE